MKSLPVLPVTATDAATRRAGDAASGVPGEVAASPRRRVAASSDVDALWHALREVRDPELPVSIVDLGLVYDIRRDGGRVDVDLTFTAIACPCMDMITGDVEERLLREPNIEEVQIHVVWDPPWTRARLSDEAKRILRKYGVAA